MKYFINCLVGFFTFISIFIIFALSMALLEQYPVIENIFMYILFIIWLPLFIMMIQEIGDGVIRFIKGKLQ